MYLIKGSFWGLLAFNIFYIIKNSLVKGEAETTWGKVVDKNSGLPIAGGSDLGMADIIMYKLGWLKR